jgi:hypothetical protein
VHYDFGEKNRAKLNQLAERNKKRAEDELAHQKEAGKRNLDSCRFEDPVQDGEIQTSLEQATYATKLTKNCRRLAPEACKRTVKAREKVHPRKHQNLA